MAEMSEAVEINEFPFVAEMPKREKSRYTRMVEQFQRVKAIVDEKGMIVPIELAARMAGVSRQRIDELCRDNRIERVDLDGHVYVTENSLIEFAKGERKAGRPFKALDESESKGIVKMALGIASEFRKDYSKAKKPMK